MSQTLTIVRSVEDVEVVDMSTEMTLRADVDSRKLSKAVLPPPVQVTTLQAPVIAGWARAIAATCIMDTEILVSDIKPSNALASLSDLDHDIAIKLKPLIVAALKRGYALRMMRENNEQPYEMGIVRKIIDVPQLSIPRSSLQAFLQALKLPTYECVSGRIEIERVAAMLAHRGSDCVDAWLGHYHQYAHRILDYGRANDAEHIVWGPERRGTS